MEPRRTGDVVPQRGRPVLRVVMVTAPVVALLAIFGVTSFSGAPRDVGEPVPAFDLERLDGEGRMSSDDLRGRAYALNFWASWCVPCREEAPELARVAGDGSGEPAFVGVNILDGRQQAQAFVDEFAIGYPNVRDEGGAFRRFRVTGIPETIFVDRDGTMVGWHVGAIDEDALRELLAELVALRPGETLRISGGGPSVGVQ